MWYGWWGMNVEMLFRSKVVYELLSHSIAAPFLGLRHHVRFCCEKIIMNNIKERSQYSVPWYILQELLTKKRKLSPTIGPYHCILLILQPISYATLSTTRRHLHFAYMHSHHRSHYGNLDVHDFYLCRRPIEIEKHKKALKCSSLQANTWRPVLPSYISLDTI